MKARVFIHELDNGFIVQIDAEPESGDMRVPVKVDFQQGMMQFMEMMNCQRRPSTYYAKTIKQATNIVLKWYAEHKAVDER